MGKRQTPAAPPTFSEIRGRMPVGTHGKRPRLEVATFTDDESQETRCFYLRAIGHKAYQELLAEHPPTDEDHAETAKLGAGRARWSIEGFPRALIQASCVDPVLSDADMDEVFGGTSWNHDEITYLFEQAYKANTTALVRRGGEIMRLQVAGVF
jgi:hypothetical protein